MRTLTPARVSLVAGVLCLCQSAVPVAAEEPAVVKAAGQAVPKPAGPEPTPSHTGLKAMAKDLVGDVKALPSRENLYWAAFGGGLALAVHPADDNVNKALVESDFAHTFFK